MNTANKIISSVLIIFYPTISSIEFIQKKLASLSLSKKSGESKKIKLLKRERTIYDALPSEGKDLILTFKRIQRKCSLPLDVLKLILQKIIADQSFLPGNERDILFETSTSLIHYLIQCNLFKKECLKAIMNMYTNIYNTNTPVAFIGIKKLFQPLFAPYNWRYLHKIQKAITTLDLNYLKKRCNKPCIPANALWNYAFLYATNCESRSSISQAKINKMLTIIARHVDPVQNFDSATLYCSCPNYNGQLIGSWLLKGIPQMYLRNDRIFTDQFFNSPDSIIIPHLSMHLLQPIGNK